MEKYINDNNKECWKGAQEDSPFSADLFHEVKMNNDPDWGHDDNFQWAFHSELGSITVLDRRTGFGWRDTETGFRDKDGKFWLASGDLDVRESDSKTIGEAIAWIKRNANNCNPDRRA